MRMTADNFSDDLLSTQAITDKFNMIETHMQALIIPFDNKVENLINSLRCTDHISGLLRKLQPYTVQVPESPRRFI